MDGQTWQILQARIGALGARIEALEASVRERKSLEALLRETLVALETIRTDLQALPQFAIRIPKRRDLPAGVLRALRYRGVVELEKLAEQECEVAPGD
jgi:hypothetical protein